MKKLSRFAFAGLLVLALVLTTASTVFASSDWADPTAAANSKDASLTATVLDQTALPGIVNDDAGMLYPQGFSADQAQIGGNGIELSGLTSTQTASVTFSVPVYQYDWSAKIYKWDGSAWVAQATTVEAPTGEDSLYHVSSAKVGNGVYALFIGYYGPVEVATTAD